MPFNALQSKPPAPSTDLGRLRILSKHAGIRSSPLIFGGISVGTAWHEYTPPSDKEKSFKLLDTFVEAGGVHIDTASGYSDEQSEEWIGDWMKERGNRDRLIISTKYTTDFRSYEIGKNEAANMCGNSRKSMHVSLHASLRKLKTDYWDWTTSIHEMMDGLDAYVKQGKVLYLGASNLPAWVVSACNEYAIARGQARFVVYQGRWNIMDRDLEQDILPVCRMYDMAIVTWGSLGSGKLKSRDAIEQMVKEGKAKPDGLVVKASKALADIGEKRGINSFAPIALAWLFSKHPCVFPIIGITQPEQLKDNIKSLSIKLSPEEIRVLDDLAPKRPLMTPYDMCGEDPDVTGSLTGNNELQLGTIDWMKTEGIYESQRTIY